MLVASMGNFIKIWVEIQLFCRWVMLQYTVETVYSTNSNGDGGGRPSSVMSLGVTSVGGHSHGHPASPIGVGSSWEDIRPQIPRALGCQRRLALADLGCTVDHLDPTPANLIPPSSFAVSCDLKALWPGVLGC